MPENVLNIIQAVILGIDIAMVVCLVITLIRGFSQGVFKFLFTSGIKWGLILICILFSKKIAEAILTASYPNIGQLDVYLVNMLAEQLQMDYETLITTYSYDLVYGVVVSTMRIVIILLTVILVSLIIYPIISLILTIFGVRKLVKKIHKGLLSRVLGMACALVVFGIFFTVTFLPYYGFLSMATDVQGTVESLESENNLVVEETNKEMSKTEAMPDASIPDESIPNPDETAPTEPSTGSNPLADFFKDFDVKRIAEKSFINKMLSKGEKNLGVRYLNFLYCIETNNKKVYIIKEGYNLSNLAPIITDLLKKVSNGEQIDLSVENFQSIVTFIQNSDIVDVLIPVGLEVAIMTKTLEKIEIEISLQEVHELNWENEIAQFDKVLGSLTSVYELVYNNMSDYKAILGEEKFVEAVPTMVKELYNLTLVKKYGTQILENKIDEYIAANPDKNYLSILQDVDYGKVLEEDVERVCVMANNAYNLGLLEEEKHFDFSVEANRNYLANIIYKLFELSFINDHEVKIIELVFDLGGFNEIVDLNTLPINEINWDTEPEALVGVLTEYLTLVGNDIKDFKKALLSENNDALINNLVNSGLFTKGLIYVLDEKIDELLNQKELNDLATLVDLKNISKENLASDLKTISVAVNNADALGILNGETNLSNETMVQELLNNILSISFIHNNESVIIDSLLKVTGVGDSLTANNIVLNYDTVIWADEIKPLSHLVSLISTNPSILENLQNITPENKVTINDLLLTIVDLQIINRSLPGMISTLIDNIGITDYKSAWLEEQKVTFVKSEWQAEVSNLVDIVEYYQSHTIDLGTINPESLAVVHPLLHMIAGIKSLTLNPVVDIMNAKLQEVLGTTKNYVNVPSDINWVEEVDLIFKPDGIFYEFSTITSAATYAQYGKMLDKMFTSTIFKTAGYSIIQDYIKTLPVYSEGVLTDEDISTEVLESVTSWETELGLIDSIDLSSGVQDGAVLDVIMQSKLLQRQIKVYIVNSIKGSGLETYYTEANIDADILAVNTKIENSKQDADATNDYSWKLEIDNLKAFADQLEVCKTAPNVENVTTLKTLANKGVITTRILTKVVELHPEIGAIIGLI